MYFENGIAVLVKMQAAEGSVEYRIAQYMVERWRSFTPASSRQRNARTWAQLVYHFKLHCERHEANYAVNYDILADLIRSRHW